MSAVVPYRTDISKSCIAHEPPYGKALVPAVLHRKMPGGIKVPGRAADYMPEIVKPAVPRDKCRPGLEPHVTLTEMVIFRIDVRRVRDDKVKLHVRDRLIPGSFPYIGPDSVCPAVAPRKSGRFRNELGPESLCFRTFPRYCNEDRPGSCPEIKESPALEKPQSGLDQKLGLWARDERRAVNLNLKVPESSGTGYIGNRLAVIAPLRA